MNQKETDEKYMWRCIQLAKNGRLTARPNPMVGAVIVADGENDAADGEKKGRIIGEGYHIRCGEGHAEVNAFASVRPEDVNLLPFSTVYVSLEPCAHFGKTPPCCDMIISKGVRRVVVGCTDPFAKVQGRGIRKMREAGIEVTVGVLEKECQWINRRFFTFHRKKRPYIILKWAQTQDGFLDKEFQEIAISSEFTRMLVHKMRAEEDAILVGRVTAERERPQLTVRNWKGPDPVSFVVSHKHPMEEILQECNEHHLQSLIVEGGRQTLQSLIDSDLWDELRVETNPDLFARNGTPSPLLPPTAKEYRREHSLHQRGLPHLIIGVVTACIRNHCSARRMIWNKGSVSGVCASFVLHCFLFTHRMAL